MATDRPSRSRSHAGAPTDIRASLPDAPSLKSMDHPGAARWIGALIRVSSPHAAMTRILDTIERLQDHPYRTNFLLLGEPGTGKEGLGRALAQLVAPDGPVVRFDVAGFPEDEALRVLCGDGQRAGAAEAADGGVLVIEELTGLAPRVQEALLRLLKAGRIRRVGRDTDLDRKLFVNAIAISDSDVTRAVATGHVRHDLYYRLARIVLSLPPLRDRPEDLGPSAIWMGNRILSQAGIPLDLRTTADLARATDAERRRTLELDSSAIDALAVHSWPGNFRELEAVLERALLLYRRSSKITDVEIQAALEPAGK